MTVLTLILFAVFGLAVGSFLNVLIVRVPAHESILHPPSKCPQCESAILTRDNIPVISWLLLRGRCRSCQEPIPAGYPLVEITNTVLWVVAAARFHRVGEAVAFALFFSILLVLSVIDLELSILPDAITLPLALVSIPVLAGLSLYYGGHDAGGQIVRIAINGFVYPAFLFITLIVGEIILRKEALGFGDVKLAISLGLWLGYLTPTWVIAYIPVLVLYSLIGGCFIGIAVGILYFVVRRKSMPFPFGPWLVLGAMAVMLWVNSLLNHIQSG